MDKKKSGGAAKKSGAVRAAEQSFNSCKEWIGFGLAAAIVTFFLLLFTSYANITDVKISCVVTIILTALALLVLACIQALLNGVRPRALTLQALWKSVSPFQKLLTLYLLLCVVSYFTSPYFGQADLWIGTSRADGLRTQLFYGLIVYIIANCVHKRQDWLLFGFAGTALVFSVIGLLQAYGVGFWIFPAGTGGPTGGFFTTIGNKNMISAILCMAIAVMMGAQVVWEDRRRNWLMLPLLIAAWFMLVIRNDSGIIGVGALLLILPVVCWNTAERVSRGLFAYGLIAVAFMLWRMLPSDAGVGYAPSFAFGTPAILGLVAATVLFGLGFFMQKQGARIKLSKKAWTILWAVLIVALMAAALVVLLNMELTPENGFLYEFKEILHGNWDDSFGSNRIYAWKRTAAMLPHTPVFGYGPDCFYLAFNENNYYESLTATNALFDFAHNEYLQIAVNYGLVGAAVYIATMISLAVRAVRRKEKSAYVLMFGLAAFIYCVQAFFSFSHLLMSPVFWVMLGLTEASAIGVDKEVAPQA